MIQWTGAIRRRTGRVFGCDALAVVFAIVWITGCVRLPPTTALDPRLPRIVVDGYPFHVRTFGHPGTPPVIVLHGGPGGDMQYLQSLSALGSEYHVLFYDQRGTGLSARDDAGRHGIDLFLADLDGIVRAHAGSRRVRLVGHSWGAMLAVAYTARHGDRVSHLVASEPGILSPKSAAEFFPKVKATQSLATMARALPTFAAVPFVKSEDGHERGDYLLGQLMSLGEGPPYECAGQRLPEGWLVRAGSASFRSMILPLVDNPSLWKWDLAAGIERTRARVGLLSSECSFIGYDYQERLHRERFPTGTQHVKIAQTGHNLFTTASSARAVAAVADFLR